MKKTNAKKVKITRPLHHQFWPFFSLSVMSPSTVWKCNTKLLECLFNVSWLYCDNWTCNSAFQGLCHRYSHVWGNPNCQVKNFSQLFKVQYIGKSMDLGWMPTIKATFLVGSSYCFWAHMVGINTCCKVCSPWRQTRFILNLSQKCWGQITWGAVNLEHRWKK